MKRYIFGARNGIYIIDLQQTVVMFRDVYQQVRELTASGGVILRRHQEAGQDPIREEAERCGQSREQSLAWRHAHQLPDHQGVDRPPEEAGRDDDDPVLVEPLHEEVCSTFCASVTSS